MEFPKPPSVKTTRLGADRMSLGLPACIRRSRRDVVEVRHVPIREASNTPIRLGREGESPNGEYFRLEEFLVRLETVQNISPSCPNCACRFYDSSRDLEALHLQCTKFEEVVWQFNTRF